MLTAILIICIVLAIISIQNWWEGITILSVGVGIIVGTVAFIMGINLVKGLTLEDKIEMYEAQNTKIEQTIDSFVENYCDYENQTYKNLTPENAGLFAISYPELTSNQVVKTQLEVYIDNNNIIKDLRAQQIDQSVYRFLIYFGW